MIQPVERASSHCISTPMPKLAMAHGTGISRYDTLGNRGMRSTESTASHTLSGTPEVGSTFVQEGRRRRTIPYLWHALRWACLRKSIDVHHDSRLRQSRRFAVFHSISPRVECEDFFAWRMLVQQLHEYSFFQSLRHFQTIDLPESLAGICVASRLVDGEAVRLELFHHTLFHCLGRPFWSSNG